MLNAECRMMNDECRMLNAECRMMNAEFWISDCKCPGRHHRPCAGGAVIDHYLRPQEETFPSIPAAVGAAAGMGGKRGETAPG